VIIESLNRKIPCNTSDGSLLMNEEKYSRIRSTLATSEEDIAQILASLANRKRLQMVTSLLEGPSTFEKLQKETGLGKTALAHHLGRLVKTGLIKHTGRGQYELSPDGAQLLRAVGEAYRISKRQQRLDAARRADYIQKVHNKRRWKPRMKELEVRIVELKPMRVASVRAISETPEHDAGKKMRAWAEPRGLLGDIENHPVFGFNNPDPSPDRKEYGYEFWIRIGPDVQPEGEIQVKQFSGGLYAVTTCDVKGEPAKNIPETWHRLAEWVNSSKYKSGKHQWLEKAHDPDASDEELVLDLYYPIEK
jgi:DNA gyrase inhibitor GyrI/DNA-binding transcriptional ArsR family regulator